jgi:hypothetical protein
MEKVARSCTTQNFFLKLFLSSTRTQAKTTLLLSTISN